MITASRATKALYRTLAVLPVVIAVVLLGNEFGTVPTPHLATVSTHRSHERARPPSL
jgi:hypothetical protein